VSTERAIGAGMLLNLGGGVGMLVLGHLSGRWPMHPLMSGFFVLGGVLIMAIGQASGAVNLLLALTVAAGFFSLGGLIGLYSLAARLYPDSARHRRRTGAWRGTLRRHPRPVHRRRTGQPGLADGPLFPAAGPAAGGGRRVRVARAPAAGLRPARTRRPAHRM
jgi:hypothetical protein